MSTRDYELTEAQQLMVKAALDAAADALVSGEWPDLPGYPTTGTVAPLLVHLAGLIGDARTVVVTIGYGGDAR